MRYLIFLVVIFSGILWIVISNSKLDNIISDETKFSFINSKDFYDLYYNDRNTVIVDLRSYSNYKLSHIDKAVYFSIESLFETDLGIPRKIKKVERLIYSLSDAGLGRFNNIGIYSDRIEDCLVLSSILYIFRVKGIYIIKDGFEGWKKNNLPISNTISKVNRGYLFSKISFYFYENVIWDLDKVASNIDKHHMVAVSSSKIKLIPSSVLIRPKFDFDRFVIGSYYNSHCISKDKSIILYGNDNYEVLQVYFVLSSILSYPRVYIFNGGINEWVASNLPTN